MRHRFSCPLRWADLDILGHVNNVRYADYLRAARDDLVRVAGAGALATVPGGLAVLAHEMTFRAPLLFGAELVVVECWLSELTHEGARIESVVRSGAEEPTTYLVASSTVRARGATGEPRAFTDDEVAALSAYLEPGPARAARAPVRVEPSVEGRYDLQLRAGDLDLTGLASDVAFVEYFQEARIAFLHGAMRRLAPPTHLRWVIAQIDIDYRAALPPRDEPYECTTRVSAVGSRSFTTDAVIRDETGREYAGCRVVLVVFDPATQRAARPTADYLAALESLIGIP